MIKQTIEYNYEELIRLKKKYELVEWLYGLDSGSADMWKYRQELKQSVKVIISEGCSDDK